MKHFENTKDLFSYPCSSANAEILMFLVCIKLMRHCFMFDIKRKNVTVSGKTRLKSEIQLASNNAKHATMGKIHANAVFRQIMSRNMYYIDFYIYFAALRVLCVIFVL